MKHFIYYTFFYILVISSCENAPTKKRTTTNSTSEKKAPIASKEAHAFYDWWLSQNKKTINLNDQFRKKLFYKRDVVELFNYLERNGLKASLFEGIQDTIDALVYKQFEPNFIKSTNVTWVNQNNLRACRKISMEAMWDCLASDYGISEYHYVSCPLFSKDKNWAIASINYMEKSGKNSAGANRLFRRKGNNSWEEVAILTYWGNFKSD